MAFEGQQTDREYPYWTGWGTVGCAIVFFGLVGGVGVSLLPGGYDRVKTGDLPTGIAMMVIGLFGIPTLFMSFWSLVAGIRDTFRPPVLRVTSTALVLPIEARGDPPEDEYGEPVSQEPPQPEVVPFAAIRRVTRGGPRFNEVMEVTHDLSATPLQLRQHMMRAADFDELELVLRTAVPAAFVEPQPPAPSPSANGEPT